MSKPMSEIETRMHILEHARMNGYEAPVKAIFKKVDEAMKNAKSDYEKQIIAVQGLQEIDSYFRAGASNLSDANIKNVSEEAVKKVLGDQYSKENIDK